MDDNSINIFELMSQVKIAIVMITEVICVYN